MTYIPKKGTPQMYKKRAIKVLKATLELFDSPEKWTKECSARDSLNRPTAFYAPDARCFCITAAVHRNVHQLYKQRAVQSNLLAYIFATMDYLTNNKDKSIVDFNDNPRTTFNGMIRMIHKTIRTIEKETI